jgi:hypothetical protein
MDSKSKGNWFGYLFWVAIIVGGIVYAQMSSNPTTSTTTSNPTAIPTTNTTTTPTSVPNLSERRMQILRPQWDVTGPDGAISIITGFGGAGERIVATSDGEETCGVGQPDNNFKYDKQTQKFTGTEFPNHNPIFLTIYGDGSGGTIEQRKSDGSTDSCGVFVTINGRKP